MLLATAADANNADEMMNSPEIKPNRPIVNTTPVKISLYKSFMCKSSLVNKNVFLIKYAATILKGLVIDND
jgi:hypothetical protein